MVNSFRVILVFLVLVSACCAGASPVRIGILNQPDFPKLGAPSDPVYLAELLKKSGYETVLLTAADLDDTAKLNPIDMPVVVLPYGPLFPGDALDNWKRYLHEGGSFFSTGGYAFDEPVSLTGNRWITASEIAKNDPKWIKSGNFQSSDGWKVDGSIKSAHFGKAEEYAGKPGLVMHNTSDSDSVFVSQDITPLKPGKYKISVKQYAQRLQGPGFYYLTVISYDKNGKEFTRKDICASRATEGIPLSSVTVQLEILPEAARVNILIALEKLSGKAGFTDLNIVRSPQQINSHYGKPMDGFLVPTDCINVFDASFPLRYASNAVSDISQTIAPTSFKLNGPFEGMVADAMIGSNSRLEPILKAQDRYGRPRGALGSIVYHWAYYNDSTSGDRSYYADSAWAIWGVTNRDIFARDNQNMAKVFTETIRHLVDKVYLAHPRAEMSCYRDYTGPVNLYVTVHNSTRVEHSAVASISVVNEKGNEIFSGSKEVSVSPSGIAVPEWKMMQNKPLPGGFYRIITTLNYDGKPYDKLDGGFWVWDEKQVTKGPKYELKNNVFLVNGRATYMPSTDMHGLHIDRWMDGPLTWYNDARAMRDMGMLQYETLEVWTPWAESDPTAAWNRFLSKISGETMATCSAGIQFMPTQILAGDVIVEDKRLEEMASATYEYFSKFPYPKNMMYYIGGDVFKNLGTDKEWIKTKWADYLRQRTDETELANTNWTPKYGDSAMLMTGQWSDTVPIIWSDFVLSLENKYIDKIGGAVKKAVPDAVVTAEYLNLPQPHPAAPNWMDPWNGRGFDISNIALWSGITGGGDVLGYCDLGTIGKPLTVGEWGWIIHPCNGLSESDGDTAWFNQNCQMFGAGAVQCRQWSWRDLSPWEQHQFDWGTVHSQYCIPKEAGRIDKCLYLLFRMPELVYKTKPVVFVIPTSHKRGNSANRMSEICAKMGSLLGMARADYSVIAEDCLEKLPKGVKALIWPMPYCPSDKTFNQMCRFVENGGALYVSGDLQYDELRRPARADRLVKLCGVKTTGQPQMGQVFPNAPVVKAAGAKWKNPFWVNRLGKGVVYYVAQNIEDGYDNKQTASVYRKFLNALGMKPLVYGGDAATRCWVRPTADGGSIYTLLNGRTVGKAVVLSIPTKAGQIKIQVPSAMSSIIWVDGKNRIRALVAQGDVLLNGKTIFSAEKMTIISALTPADIRDGKALLVTSLWSGKVRLPDKSSQTAVTGEIKDGKWKSLETRKANNGVLVFDSLQSREITIVTSDVTNAGKQVENWIMQPWIAARIK